MGRTGKRPAGKDWRLFISLDPPGEVLSVAAAWGREAAGAVPGLRPLGPEGLHLTLAFLGGQRPSTIDHLVAAIEATSRPVGNLETGAPAWLPPRRPHALALDLHDPTGILRSLRDDLVAELANRIDWVPERRKYRPHLTVGRVGRAGVETDAVLPPVPEIRFEPESLTLFRSHLGPAGARYEALFRLPLSTDSALPGQDEGATS